MFSKKTLISGLKRVGMKLIIAMSGDAQAQVPLIVVSPGSMPYTMAGADAWNKLPRGGIQ